MHQLCSAISRHHLLPSGLASSIPLAAMQTLLLGSSCGPAVTRAAVNGYAFAREKLFLQGTLFSTGRGQPGARLAGGRAGASLSLTPHGERAANLPRARCSEPSTFGSSPGSWSVPASPPVPQSKPFPRPLHRAAPCLSALRLRSRSFPPPPAADGAAQPPLTAPARKAKQKPCVAPGRGGAAGNIIWSGSQLTRSASTFSPLLLPTLWTSRERHGSGFGSSTPTLRGMGAIPLQMSSSRAGPGIRSMGSEGNPLAPLWQAWAHPAERLRQPSTALSTCPVAAGHTHIRLKGHAGNLRGV